MFGFFALSASDILKNRKYLSSDSYFTSLQFKDELTSYFNNIQSLNGIYKDYSTKSDAEKVSTEELLNSESTYNYNLKNREAEIESKYRDNILIAEKDNNEVLVKSLTTTKNAELDKVKKDNSKTLDDFRKEIIAYKNKDYENIKKAVSEKSTIKYYIKRSESTVVDTNLVNVPDINAYIKSNSLYSIKFPNQAIKNYDKVYMISQWFLITKSEGYFIIPKNMDHTSYLSSNYSYYNSVKQRIVKEAILGLASFIIGLILLIYALKKNDEEMYLIQKLTKWYNKIPFDLRIIIFVIYSSIMTDYINKVAFFYKPYNITQFYKLTVVAIFMFYLILNIRVVNNLRKNKERFRKELENCIFYRLLNPIVKSDKFKVRVINLLTLFLGLSTMGIYFVLYSVSNTRMKILRISIIYILCYMIFILFYIFKTNELLSKIIKGTEEIVSGNFNYNIEEKGSGDLLRLAKNINNMKVGFKKSLENEIKSERLKSELITNVSHDLKTPLTSIINYVDLLKKEGLSKEEAQGYIEVLDRKSQRLKTLIDDLFEASKMASGAVELNIEKVDVTALLQQSLAELDEKINKSSLIFKLKLPKQKVYASLDGKRTWRVFENLINNILKYSQPKTRVYIELIEQDHKIIITMKNISSYEMDFDNVEIFERFKRGDKSRNTEGSGLGLSIAKSILELQGGNLSIEIDGDLFKAKVIISSLPK